MKKMSAKFWLPPVAALVVTFLIGAGILKRVDKWVQDWLFQRPGVPSQQIVVIGIDEEAFDALGPYYTWDRSVMASALEALAADPDNKPAVTAIDVLYVGNTTEAADERLARAAADLGNVVTASMAQFGEQRVWKEGRLVSVQTSAVLRYEQPYEDLRSVTVQGHINAMNDLDGVLRHALLYIETEGEDAQTDKTEDAQTDKTEDEQTEKRENRVYSMACKTAETYLAQQGKELKLPAVNAGGHFYVPFTSGPGGYYDGVSIARLIAGEIPPQYWAGKIVLIGPYAAALQDAYFTSTNKSEPMYGVEFQANVIQSLLESNFKKEVSDRIQLAVLLVLGIAAMLFYLKLRVLQGAVMCTGLSLAGFGGTLLMYRAGLVTHPLWIPAQTIVLYISSLIAHYISVVRERQALALEKERISAELSLAARIQTSFLPKEFPPFPDRKEFEIFASMLPAKEVGGDLYDFFLIDDDHLGLVIADVSGKGVPAALFMTVAAALLHQAAIREKDPAKALESVNDQICQRNPEGMFVTVWLGVLEISTGTLTAVNAGHEYPAVKKPDASFELYKDRHGFVVGGMEGTRYRSYQLQLEPGTKIFLYTDGVAEATNIQEELFGTQRMIETLQTVEDRPPHEIMDTVRSVVMEFTGTAPQFDDLTMMCLHYHGDRKAEPSPDCDGDQRTESSPDCDETQRTEPSTD